MNTNNTGGNTIHKLFFQQWWPRLDKNGHTRTVRKMDMFLIKRAINEYGLDVLCERLIDMLADQSRFVEKDSATMYSYQSGLIVTFSDMVKVSPHHLRLVDYAIQSALTNHKPFKALYLLIQQGADPSHEKKLSALLDRKFELGDPGIHLIYEAFRKVATSESQKALKQLENKMKKTQEVCLASRSWDIKNRFFQRYYKNILNLLNRFKKDAEIASGQFQLL